MLLYHTYFHKLMSQFVPNSTLNSEQLQVFFRVCSCLTANTTQSPQLKYTLFIYFVFPALNLSFNIFPLLYVVILCGITDMGYFFENFHSHPFCEAYFAKVLQINILYLTTTVHKCIKDTCIYD